MSDLTARLLSEDFKDALQVVERNCDRNASISPITARILVDTIRELHARLRTAKAEGAEEAYGDIKEQAEDLRKEGGIRASLLRLLTEECVSRAAAIRKGIEAKEGK